MARMMELTTPLGKDLLFRELRGREELGRPSAFELSALSTRADIKPSDLLGKSVTVKLELVKGGFRYFNGYVTRFSQGTIVGKYYEYQMTVSAWLWFLTRTADCKIFQEKTAPEIIKEVFGDHKMAIFEDGLTGSYAKRDYCVQYRETDFAFVSRIMEEEGIYYYFEHKDGKHTCKLVDSESGHKKLENKASIAYYPPGRALHGNEEYIQSFRQAQRIEPGTVATRSFDFTKPKADLGVKAQNIQQHQSADYEVFDFQGDYVLADNGEHFAKVRVDEFHTEFELAEAETNVRDIAVGRPLQPHQCPAQGPGEGLPDRQRRLGPAQQHLRGVDQRGRGLQLHDDGAPEQAAVPPGAVDAPAHDGRPADRGGRRARAARRSIPTSTAG